MTIRLNVKMRSCRGFTLLELLFSMAISGIIMSSVYFIYSSQQRSYLVQEQVASMQQNLRAALDLMERDVRTAGCDPTGTAGAGIILANPSHIRITMDITGGENDGIDNDGDGSTDEADEAIFGDGDTNDVNEDVTFSLYTSGGIRKLGRKSPSTANNQPVAENIDALDFVCLDQRLSDGIDNDGDGTIDEYDEAIMATPVANTEDIRAVQITLVARTGRANPTYTDTAIYTNQQGAVILPQQNDNFRRKRLTAQVCCRNLAF
jgi:type IV pilus assembly protein PilW